MILRKILLPALIGVAGRVSAQPAAPPAAKTTWLVGLQAAAYPLLAQTPTSEGENGLGHPWPVQLFARYQAAGRGAEIGLLMRADPATTLTYSDAYGTHTVRATGRTLIVPLAARLRLLPRRSERWQLDAKVGFIVINSKFTREITYQDLAGSSPSVTGSKSESYSDFPLLGGVGATYRLSPKWWLTADAHLSWSYLGTLTVRLFAPESYYVAPVQPAFGMGIGYAFGK